MRSRHSGRKKERNLILESNTRQFGTQKFGPDQIKDPPSLASARLWRRTHDRAQNREPKEPELARKNEETFKNWHSPSAPRTRADARKSDDPEESTTQEFGSGRLEFGGFVEMGTMFAVGINGCILGESSDKKEMTNSCDKVAVVPSCS